MLPDSTHIFSQNEVVEATKVLHNEIQKATKKARAKAKETEEQGESPSSSARSLPNDVPDIFFMICPMLSLQTARRVCRTSCIGQVKVSEGLEDR